MNYSDGFGKDGKEQPKHFAEQVKLFKVKNVDYEKLKREYLDLPRYNRPKHCDYIVSETKELTFEEYSKWLREINKI